MTSISNTTFNTNTDFTTQVNQTTGTPVADLGFLIQDLQRRAGEAILAFIGGAISAVQLSNTLREIESDPILQDPENRNIFMEGMGQQYQLNVQFDANGQIVVQDSSSQSLFLRDQQGNLTPNPAADFDNIFGTIGDNGQVVFRPIVDTTPTINEAITELPPAREETTGATDLVPMAVSSEQEARNLAFNWNSNAAADTSLVALAVEIEAVDDNGNVQRGWFVFTNVPPQAVDSILSFEDPSANFRVIPRNDYLSSVGLSEDGIDQRSDRFAATILGPGGFPADGSDVNPRARLVDENGEIIRPPRRIQNDPSADLNPFEPVEGENGNDGTGSTGGGGNNNNNNNNNGGKWDGPNIAMTLLVGVGTGFGIASYITAREGQETSEASLARLQNSLNYDTGQTVVDTWNDAYTSDDSPFLFGVPSLRLPDPDKIPALKELLAQYGGDISNIPQTLILDILNQHFPDYIKHVAQLRGLPTDDATLEQLRQDLYVEVLRADNEAGRTLQYEILPSQIWDAINQPRSSTDDEGTLVAGPPGVADDDLITGDESDDDLVGDGSDGVTTPGIGDEPIDQDALDDVDAILNPGEDTTIGTIEVPADFDEALDQQSELQQYLGPDGRPRLDLTQNEFQDLTRLLLDINDGDVGAVEEFLGVEVHNIVDPFEQTIQEIRSDPVVRGFLDGLGEGPARNFFEAILDNADFGNDISDFINGEPGAAADVGDHIFRLLEDFLPPDLRGVATIGREAFNLAVLDNRDQLTGAALLDAGFTAALTQLDGEAAKIVGTVQAVSQYLINPTPDAFTGAASSILSALGAPDEAQLALGTLAAVFGSTAGLSLAIGSLMKIIGLDDVINNFFQGIFDPPPEEFSIGSVNIDGQQQEVMFNRNDQTISINGNVVNPDFVPEEVDLELGNDVGGLVLRAVDEGSIEEGFDIQSPSDFLYVLSGNVPDDIFGSGIATDGPQALGIPSIWVAKDDAEAFSIYGADVILAGFASSNINPDQTTQEEFENGDLDGYVDDVLAVFESGQVVVPFGEDAPIFANPVTPGGEPVEMPVGGWPWPAVVTGPGLAEVSNFLLYPTMLGSSHDPRIEPKSDNQHLWDFINSGGTSFYAVETYTSDDPDAGTPFAALFKKHPEAGVTMEIHTIPPAVPVPGYPGLTEAAPGTGLEQVIPPIQFPNEAEAREFAPKIPTIMNWIASDPGRFSLLNEPDGLFKAEAQMLAELSAQDPADGPATLSISFDPMAYMEANPDVAEMYKGNTFLATQHYVNQGQAEGRPIAIGTMASRDGAFEVDMKTYGPSEPGGELRVDATVVSVAPDGTRTVVEEATVSNQIELDTLLLEAGVIDPATIDPETDPVTAILAETVAADAAQLSEGDDVYAMTDVRDGVFGMGGNDAITGTDAANLIHGNQGDDNLVGMGGADTVYGGQGNDAVYGNAGFDKLFGNDGNDTIFGGIGYDELLGNIGNDLLHGDEGNDSVHGGQGDDQVNGGNGFDQVFGDLGNDVVTGGADDDEVFGGQGDDSVHGGQGNDMVYGGQGNDALFGDLGDDVLSGDRGNDVIDGGEGFDTARFVGDISQYDITLEGDQIRVTHKLQGPDVASDGSDLLSNVEAFDFGGTVISADELRAMATAV